MAIFQKAGKYYIDYRYQGRRIREMIGPSKRIAEQALVVRKTEILQGRYEIRKRMDFHFDVFAKEYMKYAKANKRSWLRDEGILKNLLPHFGNRQVGSITPFSIEHYKMERKAQVSPATVNREIALIKHMFNLAIQWGMASSNPMKGVKLFREENFKERVLSPEEISLLLEACTDYSSPIVLTALHTGMRKGEILGLLWSQVDLPNRLITVLHSKNGKVRKIPINDTLLKTLSDLKYNRVSEYVFNSTKAKKPPVDFKGAWQNALRRAGIRDCRFHDLRHTFASHLVASGVDLITVKELLGHSTIVMTTRYAHSAPQAKMDAVDRLDERFDAGSGHQVDTKEVVPKTATLQVVANKGGRIRRSGDARGLQNRRFRLCAERWVRFPYSSAK